jgi:hypothetical protein
MFISKQRVIWSVVAALFLDFYAFNFVARNINIITNRSLLVQILDYVFNFIIFFTVIYLLATLIIFIVKLFLTKK